METIDKETYRGFEIEIFADYDASEYLFDDLIKNHDGHIDYFTTYGRWNDYSLFDVEATRYAGMRGWYDHINSEYNVLPMDIEDYDDEEKAEERVQKWIDKNLFVLPVHVYEHGGIAMSTGGYSCPWDSGQAGFIYSDKKRACDLAGKKRMSKAVEKRVYEAMKGHIKYVDALCQGQVFGYSWEHGGCGGFVEVEYPRDHDYMMSEARAEIDSYIAREHSKAIAKKKAEITNRVPLTKRSEYAIA